MLRRRFWKMVIAVLLLAVLAGCSGTPGTAVVPENTPETATEPTAQPAEEVAEEPAEEPTEEVAGELPTTETPEAESAADTATAAARAHLARELGVAEAEIEVVSVEMTEFSDSCLGLGQPNESCLKEITPGWLVMLGAEGQEYEVHTDETGQQVRIAGEPA